MPITINDSLDNSSPKSLDRKYGVFASGTFRSYTNVAEANSSINAAYRSVGLTVLVNVAGINTEYWYQAGTSDGGLVPKGSAVSVTSPLTFSSGTIGIQVASGSQTGALSSADWTTFNSRLASVSSLGGTIQIFGTVAGGNVPLKGLTQGGAVTLTDSGTAITISAPVVSAINLGSGANVFTSLSGSNLQLKSFVAGSGISLTQNAGDITITATGSQAPVTMNTTNATPTVATTLTVADGSAGIAIVTLIALVVGSTNISSMAQRYIKYYKSGGTTIADTVGDIIPESLNTLTTAGWTIQVNGSNDLDVIVTGETSRNIKWSFNVQRYISF